MEGAGNGGDGGRIIGVPSISEVRYDRRKTSRDRTISKVGRI